MQARCQAQRAPLAAGRPATGLTLLRGTPRRPRAARRAAPPPPRAFKGGEGEPARERQQPAQPAAAVTFKAARHLPYGQVLKVVGGAPQLGDWDVGAAPAMQWGEGDQWLLSLDLPPGAAQFKLVAAPAKPERGGEQEWEAGPNRELQVPEAVASAHGAFTIVCEWGHTGAGLETLPQEELAAPGEPHGLAAPTDDDEPGGALRAEDLRAEPYSQNGDEDEVPVGVVGRTTVGKMEVEAPAEGEEEEEKAPAPAPAPAAADAAKAKVGPSIPLAESGKPAAAAGAAAPPASKPPAPAPAGGPSKAAAALGKLAEKAQAVKKGAAKGSAEGKAGKAVNNSGPAAVAQKGDASAGSSDAGNKEGSDASSSTAGDKQGASSGGATAGGKEGGEARAAVGMEAGDYPSQTPVGQGADDALGGEPAGGLKPSTEAAVKEDLRKAAAAAPSHPGLFTRLMQALGGSQQEDDDDGGQGGTGTSGGAGTGGGGSKVGGGGGGGGGGRGGGGGGGREQPPSSSAALTLEAPLPGWQVAAAAAGLAALPIVGWSEWVLKSTGCGLPPGPGGALGALEGLSYLAVGGVVLWSLGRRLTTGRGLPAGPGGALGAVEGGSWALALAGAAVLAAQVQQYGYIPGALPDSNCFGQPASSVAAASSGAAAQLAAAPPLTDASKAASPFSGPVRVRALAASLPQGNLLFSVETLLSQSGAIAEGAETAAAAVAAAAAGQPPPAQVSAAVSQLQGRVVQAQQLVAALQRQLVGFGGEAAADRAVEAAVAAAPAPEAEAAAERPAGFQPPRHRVRAALASTWDRALHSEKLQALVKPVPLPAVARQAAEAAGGALTAVDGALTAVEDAAIEAVGAGLEAGQATTRQLTGAAGERLQALLPWAHHEAEPAAAPAAASTAAAAPEAASSSGGSSSSGAIIPRKPHAARAASSGDSAVRVTPASAPQDSSRTIQGSMASVFGRVLSDLGEGYAGLWEGAKHFDPAVAAACLHERFEAAQAQQAALAAQKEAAQAAQQAAQAQQAAAKQQAQQVLQTARQPAAPAAAAPAATARP